MDLLTTDQIAAINEAGQARLAALVPRVDALIISGPPTTLGEALTHLDVMAERIACLESSGVTTIHLLGHVQAELGRVVKLNQQQFEIMALALQRIDDLEDDRDGPESFPADPPPTSPLGLAKGLRPVTRREAEIAFSN